MDQGVKRVTESEQRDDANALLRACVAYARRMLKRYGEFAPFALSLDLERKLVNETVAHADMPADPPLLLELLHKHLAERAATREMIAAGATVNITLAKPSPEGFIDALLVEIEHQDGYCAKAIVPYRMAGGQFFNFFPKVVRFGKVTVQDKAAQFYGAAGE